MRSGRKGKSARPFLTLDLETTIAKKVSETLQDRIKRIVILEFVQEKEGEKQQPLRPLATLNYAYLKDHNSFLFRSNSIRKLGDLAVLLRLANPAFSTVRRVQNARSVPTIEFKGPSKGG